MSIRMVGIDHSRAPVDVRAWFSFTKKSAAAGMERLKEKEGINGVIILSTCNRMELWASVDETWSGSLVEELCLLKELDPTEFAEYFTVREEREAAEHLFYLACGLKSRILAEDQIRSSRRSRTRSPGRESTSARTMCWRCCSAKP